jgi:hypothetical protein
MPRADLQVASAGHRLRRLRSRSATPMSSDRSASAMHRSCRGRDSSGRAATAGPHPLAAFRHSLSAARRVRASSSSAGTAKRAGRLALAQFVAMAAGRQQPAFRIEGQGFAAEYRVAPCFEQRRRSPCRPASRARVPRRSLPLAACVLGTRPRRDRFPACHRLPGDTVGTQEGGLALQYRREVGEKVGRRRLRPIRCTHRSRRGSGRAGRLPARR